MSGAVRLLKALNPASAIPLMKWLHPCSEERMSTAEILRRTAALAKADQNLEMMDCVTVLHGYMELSAFRPEDPSRQKEVDEAVGMLLRAAARYPHWLEKLSDLKQAESAESAGSVT